MMMEAKKGSNSELIKRALDIFREGSAAVEPERTAVEQEKPEPLIADEVAQILDVWRRVFGMELSTEFVRSHLMKLRAWQGRLSREP